MSLFLVECTVRQTDYMIEGEKVEQVYRLVEAEDAESAGYKVETYFDRLGSPYATQYFAQDIKVHETIT